MLAACGDGGGASASSSELSETEKSRIAEEYRDCMAEGGLEATVNFEDNGLGIDVTGEDASITEEEMRATEAACESILIDLDTGPDLSPEEEAQLADATHEVVDCVAKEGYVVSVSEDGMGIELDDADQPEGFDEAVYLEVENECFKQAVPELYAKYGPDSE